MDTVSDSRVTTVNQSEGAGAPPKRGICPLADPAQRVPAARKALREVRELSRQEGFVQPRSSFRIRPVLARQGASFDLGGASVQVPRFEPYADRITAIAAGVCTLGEGLERRVSELFDERRPSLALALDTQGTETLFRLSDQTLADIRRTAREQGLFAGEQANPGDSGLLAERQELVLTLADAADCGVSITSNGMLSPRKSVSFVVAIGPDLEEEALPWRCRHCAYRNQCRLRS